MFTETMLISTKLANGLGLTIVGMGVVFVTLILISLSLDALRVISAALDKESLQVLPGIDVQEEIAIPEEDERELVAVITAAVAASTDMAADGFIIRSIRPAIQEESLWGLAGRKQQMKDRLIIYNRRENKNEEIYRPRRWKGV